MSIILGLDLAQVTGYAIIDSNENLLAYGLINISFGEDLQSSQLALKKLNFEIKTLIKKHNVTNIILESIFTGPNPLVSARLNQCRAAAILAASAKITLINGNVKQVRKIILGSGNASKKEVFDWAVKKFNLNDFKYNKHNDITDSILLAYFGLIF